MDLIPWPVGIGIGAGSLALLFTFGIWFLRQLAKGLDPTGQKHGLVPGSAVAQLLAEKDRGLTEMRESRDYYRTARDVERDRADAVTQKLAEVTGVYGPLVVKTLNSVQEAVDQ